MKKNKISAFLMLFSGIFLTVGIGLLAGGVFWLVNALNFKATAEKITGEITRIESYLDSDGDMSHSVFVTYHYGGKLYEDVGISSYSSSMYEGKEITLYCDPERPGKIRESSMYFFGPIMLIGMGAIFACVGGGTMIVPLRTSARNKKLRENGSSIYATVEQTVYNTNVSVNGVHPYNLICTYRDDYKDITYRFRSHDLWTDPSSVFPDGSTIEVQVAGDDYSKYYVNTDELDRKIMDYI